MTSSLVMIYARPNKFVNLEFKLVISKLNGRLTNDGVPPSIEIKNRITVPLNLEFQSSIYIMLMLSMTLTN